MSFSPSRSGGVVSSPITVKVALPGVLCGCQVDSATGTGVFPIAGVRDPALSPGTQGVTLGLSSSLLLWLATSGILSQYIHPSCHLVYHKDVPSVGLLPFISLNIYPGISLLSAHRYPPCTHFQYPWLPYQGQVKIRPSLKSLGLLSNRLGAKSMSDLGASPSRVLPLVQVVRRIHQHWLVKTQMPLFWRTSCHTQWNL